MSRQYVDRLIADGRLPFGHEPGSTHRTIRVVDVERLAAQRSRRHTSTDAAITALIDGGQDGGQEQGPFARAVLASASRNVTVGECEVVREQLDGPAVGGSTSSENHHGLTTSGRLKSQHLRFPPSNG